ncbi:basal body-orientation factor 1 [Bombina bombina]|uniref:basal body-orientation factor 1 n=1 Tax=Bombina bombina TaxID=8345 RepID=UPI00235A49DE|nr:basal body-orientation factor 1 [Bombina bombina]
MPRLKGKSSKGKKGKRKKIGKNESRTDRESEAERAKANASLWEARLKVTELSRTEYREAARGLAENNEELTKHQYQLERDLLHVIGFLKKQETEKDDMIDKLQHQLITQKESAQEEKQLLVETYGQRIADLENKYCEKVKEMQLLQSEFRMIKEFRRRKMELEKELDEVKENLRRTNKEHTDALSSAERRFLEEKQRLEKEAEKKIMMLAQRAHNEAVMQLDEVGRSVFKENVRLKEAFSYHLSEMDELKKEKKHLMDGNSELLQEKETNQMLVQEKVLQTAQKKTQVQELQQKVRSLESALEQVTLELENQVTRQQQTQEHSGQVQKLHKMLEIKDREINRVKKLARNIVEERTELEYFFLEALAQVKQEIVASRNHYRHMAHEAYLGKMMIATSGAEPYPKIRTFHNKEHSTNDVHQDLAEAEKW